MITEIICAGFGGQGILTTGKLLINAGNDKGSRICWYPSYGSEMRGGTANCNVKLSTGEEIASPYCKKPDILFTMNEPAIDKFESMLKPGGLLFVNADVVGAGRIYRKDIEVVKLPVIKIAEKAANAKGANIVMLGALCKKTGLFSKEEFCGAMCRYFESKGKGKYNDQNILALSAGYEAI